MKPKSIKSVSLSALVLTLICLVSEGCQNQTLTLAPTIPPLILPTVFPTDSPTPVRTRTPMPTVTPTKTITATQEPDFASTPWAQYQCQDKIKITLRLGARGRAAVDHIPLLKRPADPTSRDYEVIRRLQLKEHIRVLNGPQCVQGVTWWEVTTESSNTGWIQEYDPSKGRFLTRVKS